jgi:hypothetical protein
VKRVCFALALAFGFAAGFASAGGVRPPGLGDVRAVRVEPEAARTRVVIELSQKVAFEVRELGSPRRLYIDIDEPGSTP